MIDTSIERRNALKISLDLALAAVARGGLRQKSLDRRRTQIAACRRALREIEVQWSADRDKEQQAVRVSNMRWMRDEKNMSLQQIADEYGITKQAVSQQLGNVGHRKLTDFQGQCLELKKSGSSIQQIADTTCKPYKSVWRVLDKLGALDKRAYVRKDGKE